MKNIYLLATDKPSKLFIDIDNEKLTITDNPIGGKHMMNQNIYIVSDEEIKEGNKSLLFVEGFEPIILTHFESVEKNYEGKKIILTTDENLIKNGVQAIDDEFLQWFINNPNCKEVEIYYDTQSLKNGIWSYDYQIIIPKEELEQNCKHDIVTKYGVAECQNCGIEESEILKKEPNKETLEKAAKNTTKKYINEREKQTAYLEFIEGAKWQAQQYGLIEIELNHTKTLLTSCEKALEERDKKAKQMCSELELEVAFFEGRENTLSFDDWFKQFKK